MPYKNDLKDFIVYSHTCFYYPRITSRGWQRTRPSPRLKPLARLSAVDTSGNAVCPGGLSYVSLHLHVKAWRGIKVVQDGRICIKDCSILEIGRQEDERQSLNRCSRIPGERCKIPAVWQRFLNECLFIGSLAVFYVCHDVFDLTIENLT